MNIQKLEKYFSENIKSTSFAILADHYYSEKQFHYAYKICEIGLKYHPNHIIGQYIFAKTLLIQGKISEAQKLLETNIVLHPTNLNAYLLLLEVLDFSNAGYKKIIYYINKAMLLFDSNPKVKYWNKKYNLQDKTNRKVKVESKLKHKNIKFKLDKKLANKTFYNLLFSQKKYSEALYVLDLMSNNKNNQNFIKKEKNKLKKFIRN